MVRAATVIIFLTGVFFVGKLWINLKALQNPAATIDEAAPSPTVAMPTVNPAAENILKITSRDHVRGSRFAEIALIEYGDLECPYCKSFQPTLQQMITVYQSRVMWVYRHFPLIMHANAQKEAEASECAYDQGGDEAFWTFINNIFDKTGSNGTGFSLDQLYPLAVGIGLNGQKFQQCLDSGKYKKYVMEQESAGLKAGVSGTPGSFVVNLTTGQSQAIAGAVTFEQLKSVIDGMLK